MTGGAEITSLTGESQKDLVVATLTLDPGKSLF